MKSSIQTISTIQRVFRLAALAFCLLAFQSARAANDYWAGVPGTSVDTNWTTAANWTSAVQTYYNEVEFLGVGQNANNVFTVNNVLNATTGVSQMPIWELDMAPTNGNYTTLISPGITMSLAAGNGDLKVGADILHTASPAPANAVETITFQGPGAELSMAGTGDNLIVAQGSTTPNDAHNVTLDLSGLDNFVDNGSGNYIYVAANGAPRANGTLYLAKTNVIALGNGIQICNQSSSNSMPVAVYLGIQNSITVGSSGNLLVGGTGTTTAGAFLEFNPAFLGGANPPAATFGSAASNGRINNFYVCNNNGAPEVPGNALCNLSGGSIYASVATLQVALSGTGACNANGVLTFDMGAINASSAYLGRQQNSAGGMAVGTVNINSNSTYGAGANLIVGGTLSLAAVTGTLTPGTAGTVNINGGALSAAAITAGAGASAINSTLGTITVGGTAGTLASPIGTVTLTNSTLNLTVASGATNLVAGSLTTSGANVISIVSVPPATAYPVQVSLVKYGSLGGAGYNFSLGTLPLLCAGYLSNNTANASVDLVLTAGPIVNVWSGAVNDNWDTTTANWLANGTPGDYANGQFVLFPDGADTGTVSLTTALTPAAVTVTNSALTYTFTGSGSLAGSTALIKAGAATLIIDNSGNTFTGGVNLAGGTLQVGNNDTSGNLPAGAIADNGALVFDRTDNNALSDTISGSGSVAVAGGGQMQLSGANTFTGQMLVTNNSILQLGSSSGAGVGTNSLVIANGSTLDVNGYAGYRPILVAGTGVNGNGAIINSGGAVYDSGYGIATNVTLTADATFNVNNSRWDMGAPSAGTAFLSTGGHPYNLTLESVGYFEWKNLAVDTNLADINLMTGTWGLVGTTAFGNPNATLTVASGAALDFYGSAVSMNKQVDLQDGAIDNSSGANVMNGGLILESGYCSFDLAGGTSLTIGSVLTGPGVFYQETGAGSSILDGNSPNFTGGVLLDAGQMTLNGTIGSGITSYNGTTLAGSGVASNLVDVAGALLPGGASTVGTFTAAGGLTLESTATLTMDLGASTSVGGNTSDLLAVVGNLTVNGNNITINPIAGTLANGAYTLFTYTGTLSGSFGTATTVSSSRYSFTIDTSVPNLVRLIVTGVPNLLVWNNGSDNSQWDVQSSLNWSNLTTHAEDQFYTADTVTFDDSINSAKYPSTSVVISSGQVVAPSLLTNNSTASYIISGPGKISGAAKILKQGSGTLTLNTTNDFSGGISILGGTVVAHTNAALGSAIGAITISNNATLDVGYALGSKPIFVSGAGVGGNGALVNNSPNAIYDSSAGLVAGVTLTGNTTFGGTTRWDLGVRGTTGTVLSTGGNPYNLTVTGSSGLYFEWDNLALDTNLANITIMPGITLGTIGATTYGNPTNTLTISSNATLVFYNDGNATPVLNKQVQILNGGTLENGGGATPVEGPVILGVNSGDICDFYIGGTSLAVSNVISGAGSLDKISADSPLYLSATNTYTGSTVVSNGVLALTGNGSISSSPSITVVSGATVDVSGRTDETLTLASGQTLQGNGTVNGNLVVGAGAAVSPGGLNAIGTLTVNNAVTLSGTAIMEVNKTALTHDQIAGATGITYGGTLAVTNLAGTLAAGDSFKLFSAGSYSGAFAAIAPATPGAGLAWNTNTLSSGVLTVASSVSVPPTISGITVSGANFVITGTNNTGSAGTYHILTTTNLAISLTNWVVLTNGSFGGNGSFASTNAIGANAQQYFILQEP